MCYNVVNVEHLKCKKIMDEIQKETLLEKIAQKDDKIFELNEYISKLRNQVTYLQEELASVEDTIILEREKYEKKIEELEQQLGNSY